MADTTSDEAFARAVNQMGAATHEHIEAARQAQAEGARKGIVLSLAEVMVQRGMITPVMRESIEKRLQAQQTGGLHQLGPYKLLKKLGEGGMGAVYLAEDTSVGRKVAVKVLPRKYADDHEFLTRFRREAQATGKLNHVNIVLAYNVGEDMGHHYYAMEYCEGDTLDRILKRDKVLPWDKAVSVVVQVARGLKHAHEHGIIHRDIKPANIFICAPLRGTGETPVLHEGLVAKILDLGLSKNISGNEQSFYTQTGVALGTPHYISPEQAKGEKGIDGRTDIYSLGATLYHLVTGQTPFQGSTAALIMMKHLNEELPNPQDLNPDIPDGVALVVAKMMAKDPIDRYRDCTELLSDLEQVLDGKMPSSQAIDAGKSSVAVARVPRRVGQAVQPAGRKPASVQQARQPAPQRGTRQHEPVTDRRRGGRRVEDAAEGTGSQQQTGGAGAGQAARGTRNLYIGAGVAGLGALTLIVALMMRGGPEKPETEKRPALSADSGTKQPAQAAKVAQPETKPADVQPGTTNPKPEIGVTDAWVKMVQALPAEEQVGKVVEKLKELNPGWDGPIERKVAGGVVTSLSLSSNALRDLSPVTALVGLRKLTCRPHIAGRRGSLENLGPLSRMKLDELNLQSNGVRDLSPLKGMPLQWFACAGNPVEDLSPLAGMSLVKLDCPGIQAGDLAPIKDLPLKSLRCDFVPERDAAILRSIKTLGTINDMPVAEFWKKYPEAGAAKPDISAGGNPLKRAKVGDWVEYALKVTVGGKTGDSSQIRQTVTKKSETEVTIEMVMKTPATEMKQQYSVDLTRKAYQSPVPGSAPTGPNTKQLESGTEVLTLAGRRLTSTWTLSETKVGDKTIRARQWTSPDVPVGGIVKAENTIDTVTFAYELKDFGFGQGTAANVGENFNDPERWKNAINLLALVDPKQDTKAGKWELKDGGLLVEPGDDSKLRLPYRPPAEYDFRVRFTRQTGDECVMQCLRAGGHSFRWRMGGWRNTVFGFGVIGKDDADANASRVQAPQCLRNGTQYTAVVRVRTDGVEGWLDGKLITKWRTGYQDMSLLPNWTLGDDSVLGLACQFSRTHFHSAEVLEVFGKGTFTRPDDPAAKDAERKRTGAAMSENNYANAHVGDWIESTTQQTYQGKTTPGSVRMTAIKKTDKEVVIEMVIKAGGQETKQQLPVPIAQKTAGGAWPAGTDIKQLDHGTEVLTVAGKQVRTYWTLRETIMPFQGKTMTMRMKEWISPDVPFDGRAKQESSSSLGGSGVMELKDFGFGEAKP